MPSAPPLFSRHSLQESVAITAVIGLLLLTGVITCRAFVTLQCNREMVRHTHEVILNLTDIESTMKDAETGQRGFIITGRDEYLEPFETPSIASMICSALPSR